MTNGKGKRLEEHIFSLFQSFLEAFVSKANGSHKISLKVVARVAHITPNQSIMVLFIVITELGLLMLGPNPMGPT